MKEYKGYVLRKSNGLQYPFKARPYDNADYYCASSLDGRSWIIKYKGKHQVSIKGRFEDAVDLLEKLNKDIKPIICHN